MTKSRVILPKTIYPSHYSIMISPNFSNLTFEGAVSIDLKILTSVEKIILNSLNLSMKEVKVTQNNKTNIVSLKSIEENKEDEMISFDSSLDVGTANLKISYNGVLNDSMSGFYYSTIKQNNEKKIFGCTQFEPVFARRAFPCWDEPAHKATFDVTLKVPSKMVAISNTQEKNETIDSINKTKVVEFERSPIMSTYLVAWVIGDLEYLQQRTINGTIVRVYTAKGKIDQAEWALSVAVRTLPLYEKYFNIPYVLKKLDMVAIPDFSMGAMENWGLVTYRDTAILCTNESSQFSKERVTTVVTHELAHQWFGNLVTMQWWSQLWLNEGFASYMEILAAAQLFPKWNLWTDFVESTINSALNLDALRNSHPVENEIYHPKEIDEKFDTISYNKGASLVRMASMYVGEDNFKEGLRNYLKKFKYSNTITEDLWDFIGKASKKDVRSVMDLFTKKQGFPLVKIEYKEESGNDIIYYLKQSRFLASGKVSSEEDNVIWKLPIQIDVSGKEKWIMFDKKEDEIKLPKDAKWIKFNSNTSGFFRTYHDAKLMENLSLASKRKEISATDRFMLLSDSMALSRAGYCSITDFLSLISNFKDEDDFVVWSSIQNSSGKIKMILEGTNLEDSYNRFAIKIFENIYNKLGWEKKKGDDERKIKLRTGIIGSLGSYEYKSIIDESKKRFAGFIETGSGISEDLKGIVFNIACKYGGLQEYEKLQEIAEVAKLPIEKIYAYRALGRTRKVNLLKRTLEYALSDRVRKQDAIYVVSSVYRNPLGREIAWKWMMDNYDKLRNEFTSSSLFSSFVSMAGYFTSHEKADELERFYKDKDKLGFKLVLLQTVESIRLKADWLKRDKENIAKWLSCNGKSEL